MLNLFNTLTGYNKPGPGIDKNRPKKKRFFLFFELYFRKFTKLIQLNLLYLICCLPIITIGPATAGFVYILRCYAREEHAFLMSDFFDAAVKNWKQSFISSLINGAILALCCVSIGLYSKMIQRTGNGALMILMIPCITFLAIFIVMNFYFHLILITFKLKLSQIYKNSFLFVFLGLKTNIITLAIVGVLAFLLYRFYPFTIIFLVPLAISTIGFIIIFNTYPLVKKYMIDRYYEQHPEEKVLHYYDEEYQEEMEKQRLAEMNEHSFDYLPVKKVMTSEEMESLKNDSKESPETESESSVEDEKDNNMSEN